MRIILVVLLATSCALTASSTEPAGISVMPRHHMGPRGAFRVIVTVERDAANRLLVTTLDGEGYLRRSTEQLEGEDSARVRATIFDNVPSGHYTVSAVVMRNDGKRLVVTTEACVMGPTVECS